MRKIFNLTALFSILIAGLISCTKDENRVYFENGNPPVFTASLPVNSKIPLSYDDRLKDAIKLSWTNPDYRFTTGVSSQDVNYTLEIDSAGKQFKGTNKRTLAISKELSHTFKTAELNTILVSNLKLDTTIDNTIEMRIIARIGLASETQQVSNTLSFIVKPYGEPVLIYYLWVPGSHQGWAPEAAPRVGSEDNKAFEGYVNFADPNTQFKFTSEPSWSGTNYGDGSGGALNTDGGAGNLTIAEAGFYRLKPNIDALTWSYEKISWAMIGGFNGWAADAPLTYNSTTGKLEIASINLTAGGFKFRANGGWDIQLGYKSTTPDYLSYSGDDITIPETAEYKVELDLRNPLQYTYTLTKL